MAKMMLERNLEIKSNIYLDGGRSQYWFRVNNNRSRTKKPKIVRLGGLKLENT